MQSLIWKSDPGKPQQESGRRNKERGGIQQQRCDSEQVTVVVSLVSVLIGTSERAGRTCLRKNVLETHSRGMHNRLANKMLSWKTGFRK